MPVLKIQQYDVREFRNRSHVRHRDKKSAAGVQPREGLAGMRYRDVYKNKAAPRRFSTAFSSAMHVQAAVASVVAAAARTGPTYAVTAIAIGLWIMACRYLRSQLSTLPRLRGLVFTRSQRLTQEFAWLGGPYLIRLMVHAAAQWRALDVDWALSGLKMIYSTVVMYWYDWHEPAITNTDAQTFSIYFIVRAKLQIISCAPILQRIIHQHAAASVRLSLDSLAVLLAKPNDQTFIYRYVQAGCTPIITDV
jgi:hypothetical protein